MPALSQMPNWWLEGLQCIDHLTLSYPSQPVRLLSRIRIRYLLAHICAWAGFNIIGIYIRLQTRFQPKCITTLSTQPRHDKAMQAFDHLEQSYDQQLSRLTQLKHSGATIGKAWGSSQFLIAPSMHLTGEGS